MSARDQRQTWSASTPTSAPTSTTSSGPWRGVVDEAGRATDADQLAEDALTREATAATGLNGGIAIPHCRSVGVEDPDPGLRAPLPRRGVRRQGRTGRPGLPDRGPGRWRRVPPQAAGQAGPRPGEERVHRQPARRHHAGRDRRAGRRGRRRGARSAATPATPAAPAAVATAATPATSEAAPTTPAARLFARRGHCLPDRHRPHLHGRRGSGGSRRARRRGHPGRDPGLGRRHAAVPRGHHAMPTPSSSPSTSGSATAAASPANPSSLSSVKRPIEEGRQDDRRGAPLRRRPQCATRRGLRRRRGLLRAAQVPARPGAVGLVGC